MGAFSGIGEAEVYERGNYLKPGGMFLLVVKDMLLKETQNSGLGFIVEFEVLESTLEEDHPVGSKATWFQSMTKRQVALPAIKEFMAFLLKVNLKDSAQKEQFNSEVEDILNAATDFEGDPADHPMYGEKIRVHTYTKLTQNNKEFTVHDWEIVEE